jgi:phospholipid transport system substrate-binding protein
MRKPAIVAFFLAVLAVSAAPAAPAPQGAVDKIKAFYASLIDTMKRGKELGLEGRFKQIAPAVEKAFDLPAMTRLSVGPAWNTLSESDRGQITEAFRRLTIANYAKNFASFAGEAFVTEPAPKPRNEDQIVESKLIGSDKAQTPFNYRMHVAGEEWKILDVYLNGYVSQLAVRRSDFSSTVASSGAAGLVKKINELADRQMKEG